MGSNVKIIEIWIYFRDRQCDLLKDWTWNVYKIKLSRMALSTLVYTSRKIQLLSIDLGKTEKEARVREKRWAILTRTTLPG